MPDYPDTIRIQPVQRPVDGIVAVPGSKSITNRALLLAAMALGDSVIEGALFSDDTRYMAAALNRLGIVVRGDPQAERYQVEGRGGRMEAASADLFIGNAGTAARFLAAFLTTGYGEYRLDGIQRMRHRPIGELVTALQQLGARILCEHEAGCLPILVSGGLRGGFAQVRSSVSSQFLTALLMVAPLAPEGVVLSVEGDLASEPYVRLTLDMMRQWGVHVEHDGMRLFRIPEGQRYSPCAYRVEPDASSASYFYAAAALTGGRVCVEGLGTDALQGDARFVDVLEKMGCHVDRKPTDVTVQGPRRLHGVTADMNGMSDAVMTLAAIAPFADGPTSIVNVAHIRHKESDRISGLVAELGRMGVRTEEREDGLTIHPCEQVQPCAVDTYDDHRMAMSFSILGLRAPGITIRNPDCVAKTFPDFFERLDALCAPCREGAA